MGTISDYFSEKEGKEMPLYTIDTERDALLDTLDDVDQEYAKAIINYGPMRSAHEGYAILKEEVDELWDEVRLKPSVRDLKNLRKEAIQVAAMAIRFVIDSKKW